MTDHDPNSFTPPPPKPQKDMRPTAQRVVDNDFTEYLLKRGEQVNLTRIDPTLKMVTIGMGWDVVGFDSEAPDLDASLFLLDKNDKTRVDEDFVFYNNPNGCNGAIEHLGDNRTGAGDGDDEVITIDLMALPFDVMKIAFVVSIYDAAIRGHDFKNIRNTFLRVMNKETGIELMKFNLDREFQENPKATGVIVGVMLREGPNWFFEARGELVKGGLEKIATDYGIIIG